VRCKGEGRENGKAQTVLSILRVLVLHGVEGMEVNVTMEHAAGVQLFRYSMQRACRPRIIENES
jgi:hypothetical protein